MQSPNFGDAKTLGSTAAEELWKKAPEDSEPRPLKIKYTVEHEDHEPEELGIEHVVETVFEDPNEAAERPRLLVPLHSVLGLKALCEREFIRTEAVTDMLNQCRTAYYKELLYLREQLILAAEPEKQMMLGAVQNYEVYFFNPPAYVDEDLKEYMLNCSRWTHKKLIEENYELQMKLSGAGQNDVFDNADFCLKGLLRRHGTYKLFKTFHSVVSHAKDLFNPEDMIRRQEKEGLKPIDELQAAITELFPNLRSREDNSGALLGEIDELQRALTDAKAELARLKGLLDSERNRSDELAKKVDDQEKMLQGSPKVTEVVDNKKVEELQELNEKMQQEVDAQAERLSKMIKDLAAGKSYELGRSRKDATKVFPKLDEAILDLDKLFAKIAKETPQIVTEKVSDGGAESLARAQKEIQQLKQEIAALKAKLAAAEQREQDALAKLKDAAKKKPQPENAKVPESPRNGGLMSGDVDELKKQLERKIAKVAELETELDQAKKDLRAAQRTIDEKDLLLQEKARKDADTAKKMSELMEKLRKSEEEAEKLAGKLYKAEEKIKQLKEQIRELKNQLGMPQEQSEEEVEEEVDTSTVFMSRYYLRAKNSGKPRWMLLSEDAKYKSQKKNQDDNKQVAGPGVLPGQMGFGGQPQEASRAFNFLRKAPGAPSRQGTQVRLQYSFTQNSMGEPGIDSSPSSQALSRMNTFHGMQDNSPMADAAAHNQRLMHANSMPFSTGGMSVGDSPGVFSSPSGFGMLSRQSTQNSLLPGPNGPGGAYIPRASTPPQAHPIYAPGGGAVFHNASWRGGQSAPSTGPAYTSAGPMMSNPFRQDGSVLPVGGVRLGTPPIPPAGSSHSLSPGGTSPNPPLSGGSSPLPDVHSTGSTSLALGGFSPNAPGMSSSGLSPGSLRPTAEEDVAASSTGLPLRLEEETEEEVRSPMLQHSNSSVSLSPTSSRVAHVGLAMVDPMSPQERPMLQLIPQRAGTQDLSFMVDSSEALNRPGGRILQRQAASWSSFPLDGRGGPPQPPNVVNLSMPDHWAPPEPRADPVLSTGDPTSSQVAPPQRLLHTSTVPLDVELCSASTPVLSSPAAASSKAETGSRAVGSQGGDSVDMLLQHAKSQPLSGGLARPPDASAFVSWVAPKSTGPKPLTNGSLPLTNSFKGKVRSMKSTPNLDNPVYISADSRPRLPGGKVRKAPQQPSWLTPL